MNTYTTKQGDTWDLIAREVYGDEMMMDELIDANVSLRHCAIFSAGIVVNVPYIDTEAIRENEDLPIWKKGAND